MPNIKEMFEEVEAEFIDRSAPSGYKLKTIDDEYVRIGRQLWTQSIILTEFAETGDKVYRVKSDGITVRLLIQFHQDRTLPNSPRLRTALLSLLYQLKLSSLLPESSRYRRLLCHDLAFHSVSEEAARSDVLHLFSALCEMPPRKKSVFMEILRSLQRYSDRDSDFMDRVVATLKSKLERMVNLGLYLLPITFTTTNAAVAIMSYHEEKRVYLRQDGTWFQAELFGRHFALSKYAIKDFYLYYGSYILFKDDGNSVFFKDLTNPSEPTLLMSDCQQMLVCDKHVFILTLPDKRCPGRTILRWDGMNFSCLKSDTAFGRGMTFSVDRQMLALIGEPDTTISVFHYSGGVLSLVANLVADVPLQHICFYQQNLYTWGDKGWNVKYADTGFAPKPNDEFVLEKNTTDIRVVNQKLFKHVNDQWHAYTNKEFYPITLSERAQALSEVVLLP